MIMRNTHTSSGSVCWATTLENNLHQLTNLNMGLLYNSLIPPLETGLGETWASVLSRKFLATLLSIANKEVNK